MRVLMVCAISRPQSSPTSSQAITGGGKISSGVSAAPAGRGTATTTITNGGGSSGADTQEETQ